MLLIFLNAALADVPVLDLRAHDADARFPSDAAVLTVAFPRMTFADAAILVCDGHAGMIDAGGYAEESAVQTALEALGVTHLTGVIVTHMDKDHYGGAKQLAESDIAIDGWYASWAWEKEKWKKHPVVKAAAIRGEEITLLQPGDTLSDGLLTVIGPIQEREESENDNSLVLVASAGGGKMLLTGDMEYDEENDLLAAGVIPSCEVLKVGHHGRDDATSAALVAAVQPKVAVISTSSVILPESPAKRVLRVLSSAGAQIVQTQQAEIGVRVTISGGNVTVESLNN